ncbi:hypothetical protein GUJ93_ZPchr0006g43401 [Zizania palustris]|uniref:Uncharacterized protein n=1 Tax=Zizania palustris TaxID=103762 RepID=A0A8J5VNV4_ZIZPA|nr:hypothetical protein GUJ93_ZPchr0006g43401 [Zizania palustris]
MITRAKLVEQLREHQIRSAQSYSAALAVFSPSPHIASRSYSWRHPLAGATVSVAKGVLPWTIRSLTRRDLKVALFYAILFCFLMVSCYVTLYLRWFRLSAILIVLGILLPDYSLVKSQLSRCKLQWKQVAVFCPLLNLSSAQLALRCAPCLTRNLSYQAINRSAQAHCTVFLSVCRFS